MRKLLPLLILALVVALSWARLSCVGGGAPESLPERSHIATEEQPQLDPGIATWPSRDPQAQSGFASLADERGPMSFVSGTLLVKDSDGRPHQGCSGTIWAEVWQQSTRAEANRRIRVRTGQWSTSLATGAVLKPLRFVSTHGRKAAMEETSIAGSQASDCVLAARWLVGTQLAVLDSQSGEPLSDVQLYFVASDSSSVGGVQEEPQSHADMDRWMRGASPLELPCFEGARGCWVRSPGYEHRYFAFEGCQGLRTLGLGRSAELQVIVDPGALAGPFYLSVLEAHSTQGRPIRVVKVPGAGRYTIDGLPNTELRVVLGKQGRLSVVDLLAWETAPVSLANMPRIVELCAQCPAQEARAGSIRVQADLGAELELRSVLVMLENTEEPWSLEPARLSLASKHTALSGDGLAVVGLVPGQYRVDFDPPFSSQRVHVRAASESIVQIVAEQLGTLDIHVFREGSEEIVQDAKVLVRRPGSKHPQAWLPIGFDPKVGLYQSTIPLGEYEVAASLEGYQTCLTLVELREIRGQAVVELRSSAKHPVKLTAVETGSRVVLPSEWWTSCVATPLDPTTGALQGVSISSATQHAGDQHVLMNFSGPGKYLLRFAPLPEYEALEPFEVLAEGSDPREYILVLRPKNGNAGRGLPR